MAKKVTYGCAIYEEAHAYDLAQALPRHREEYQRVAVKVPAGARIGQERAPGASFAEPRLPWPNWCSLERGFEFRPPKYIIISNQTQA